MHTAHGKMSRRGRTERSAETALRWADRAVRRLAAIVVNFDHQARRSFETMLEECPGLFVQYACNGHFLDPTRGANPLVTYAILTRVPKLDLLMIQRLVLGAEKRQVHNYLIRALNKCLREG